MPTLEQIAAYGAALDFAQKQVKSLIERDPDFFPMYTVKGKWRHGGEKWTHWTDGFLGGQMWQFFLRNGDPWWRSKAEHYSKLLEHRQHDRDVHDLGFIFLSTYLPWYEMVKREGEAPAEPSGTPQRALSPATSSRGPTAQHLHDVLIQAGRTLSMRFKQHGQYLRSFVSDDSLFIDIMMNVPIIFYAAIETGDRDLARIATAHCRTTRDKIVRANGSTAHEGIFDLATGKFLREDTHQGLAPHSAWARGLAWSLYGYSKCYALTGNREFLDVAERNAGYWIEHLPADGVPYWDFDADLTQPPPWGGQKESSAGAIAASGLLDLARQTGDAASQQRYEHAALKMLDALVQPEYLASETPGWDGILKHGVYHTKKNLGVDESVMWGEYFFVEALTKVVINQFDRVSPEALERNRQRYAKLA
jgi:unsaturated chondroitin disaccharide hydrolase